MTTFFLVVIIIKTSVNAGFFVKKAQCSKHLIFDHISEQKPDYCYLPVHLKDGAMV